MILDGFGPVPLQNSYVVCRNLRMLQDVADMRFCTLLDSFLKNLTILKDGSSRHAKDDFYGKTGPASSKNI